MRKKKKIKKTSLNLKKRKRIFIKFKMPIGIGSGQSTEHFLIEARHLQKGLDILHRDIAPGKKGSDLVVKNLQQQLRYGKINWFGFILFAETLGINSAKAYGLLGNYFSSKEIQKNRVKFLNPTLVKSLLIKIDKWGGVPKAWKNHKAYINSWCRKTGTPLFNSLSNFGDLVTAWREATVGKRKKKIVPHFRDKEFKI
jgi:hypothetical protein